jgi:hypothetical protein
MDPIRNAAILLGYFVGLILIMIHVGRESGILVLGLGVWGLVGIYGWLTRRQR